MSSEGERTKDKRLRKRRGLRFEEKKKEKKKEEETDGETREKNE